MLEDLISYGTACSTWQAQHHVSPQSPSFMYLVLVFLESSNIMMSSLFTQVAENRMCASPTCTPSTKRVMCSKYPFMMCSMCDGIVRPWLHMGLIAACGVQT